VLCSRFLAGGQAGPGNEEGCEEGLKKLELMIRTSL
jgi:hypothetical protein